MDYKVGDVLIALASDMQGYTMGKEYSVVMDDGRLVVKDDDNDICAYPWTMKNNFKLKETKMTTNFKVGDKVIAVIDAGDAYTKGKQYQIVV